VKKENEIAPPILSICLITYNQKQYIHQAIKGVLMQKTNFAWELIIADDFSTDGTREILLAYKKQHPKKIKLILQKKNVGPAQNFKCLITAPKSKYIAYFEGDDSWTDPLKLQKQVDFLEANNDYAICFHRVKVFNENKQQFVKDTITREVNKTTTLKDLAEGNYIHTPSTVFRNKEIHLPTWFFNTPIGDYPLWCICALNGKIYKMEEEMAVYRVHNKGIMSSLKNQDLRAKITFNDKMLPFYKYIFKKSGIINFRKELIHLIFANQSYAIQLSNYKISKSYAKKLLKKHLFYLSAKQLIATVIALFFPLILKKRYGKQH